MAGRKFYSVTVKPKLTASKQTGAYASGDVLFDWTEVPVDRGTSRLVSVQIVFRGTDGAEQSQGLELFFSKSSSENTLGVENATATMYPSNDIVGFLYINDSAFSGSLDTFSVSSGMATGGLYGESSVMITPDSGESIYIAGTVLGALDFSSTVQCDGVHATSQAGVTVKTTDARNTFAAGDLLHDEDDRVIGTVSSVNSATSITMTSNLENATIDNKDLYNVNPVTIILGFEA